MTDLTGLLTSGTEIVFTLLQSGLLDLSQCEFGYDGRNRFVKHLAFRETLSHVPGLMGRESMLSNSVRSLLDFAEENVALRAERDGGTLTGMQLLLLFAEKQLTLYRDDRTLIVRVGREARRGIDDPEKLYTELLRTICRYGNESFDPEVILEGKEKIETEEISEGLQLSYVSGEAEDEPEEVFEDLEYLTLPELPAENEEPEEDDALEEPEAYDALEEPEAYDALEEPEAYDESEEPEEDDESEEPEEDEAAESSEAEEEEIAASLEALFGEAAGEAGADEGEPSLTEREQNVRKNADAALQKIREVFETMEKSAQEPAEEIEEEPAEEIAQEPAEETAERTAEALPASLVYSGKRRALTEHFSAEVPEGFSYSDDGDGAFFLWKKKDSSGRPEDSVLSLRECGYLPGEALGQRLSLSAERAEDRFVYDAYVQLFDGVSRFRLEAVTEDRDAADRLVRELLAHIS